MGVQIQGDTGNVIATKGTYSGNVTIGGTLTYEDVTNVDSIGLVTARNGIEVGARPGVAASISVDGNAIFSGITTIGGNVKVGTGITLSPDGDAFHTGVVTATSFVGDGSGLTGAGPTLANGSNDRIVTATGANALNGEANLQFDGTDLYVSDKIKHLGDTDTLIEFGTDTISFDTAGTTRATIDSGGKLNLTSNIKWASADAYVYSYNGGSDGQVRSGVEYSGNNQYIRYFTSTNERMRLLSGGSLLIGRTSASSYGNLLETKSITVETDGDTTGMHFNRTDSNSAWVAMRFYIQQNQKGYIQVNVNDVTYSTGSDYRLKENAVSISDGITRLKQLKPYKFNWKSNPSGDKVDGFFAHEVSDIVPQAVSGEKDAVDKDGNPDHQVIDHSKLVPLLTAALQEAVTEIESLKARLDAAGL